MRKWELDQQALEEFLVGCKQKEKIFLTLEEESRAFTSLTEPRKEIFTIKKNTWGYLAIDVHTEGEFLNVGAYEDHHRRVYRQFLPIGIFLSIRRNCIGEAISGRSFWKRRMRRCAMRSSWRKTFAGTKTGERRIWNLQAS